MIFKFRCCSQAFIKCDIDGLTRKISFNIMAEGGSYYNTNIEKVAEGIRASRLFRRGMITECEPEEEKVEESEEPVFAPEEEQVVIKTKLMGRPSYTAAEYERPSYAQEDHAITEEQALSGTDMPDEAENAPEAEGEGQAMAIEEVKSYMEAKEYLKTVLHVDAQEISTKQKTQEYCQDRGIVFPNFGW